MEITNSRVTKKSRGSSMLFQVLKITISAIGYMRVFSPFLNCIELQTILTRHLCKGYTQIRPNLLMKMSKILFPILPRNLLFVQQIGLPSFATANMKQNTCLYHQFCKIFCLHIYSQALRFDSNCTLGRVLP